MTLGTMPGTKAGCNTDPVTAGECKKKKDVVAALTTSDLTVFAGTKYCATRLTDSVLVD